MKTSASPRPAHLSRLVLWLAALGGQLTILLAAGGALPGPERADPASLTTWLDERGPLVVTMTLARLVALACCTYLLVTVTLGLLVRLTQLPTLVKLADLVTIPHVRRLLHGSLGVGLTLAATTTGAAAAQAPPTVVMRVADHQASPAEHTAHHSQPPPPVMRALDDQPLDSQPLDSQPLGDHPLGEHADPSDPSRPADPPDLRRAVEPTATTSAPKAWTVSPGEHLWGIAQRILAETWSRPPTDAETDAYLDSLVARNGERLAVPSNPDLIFPGQVFELPPVPQPLTGA